MRGYERLGRTLILVVMGNGERKEIHRMIYERLFVFPPVYLISYQKLWRRVEYKEGQFVLDMKRRTE